MKINLLGWPSAVNAGLGVLAVVGAVWAFQTVTVASTTSTSTSGQRIVAASVGNVVATVSASGTVQSANTANADFGTSGTVTEIDAKVGDVVTKGQRVMPERALALGYRFQFPTIDSALADILK